MTAHENNGSKGLLVLILMALAGAAGYFVGDANAAPALLDVAPFALVGVGGTQVLGIKQPPTSVGGVKRSAKMTVGIAWGVTVLLIGLGIFALALPFLSRIPFLGPLINSGRSMLPGQASAPQVTSFGRRLN